MSRHQLLVRIGLPIVLLSIGLMLTISTQWGMVYPEPGTESAVFMGYRIPATVLQAEPGGGGQTMVESTAGANKGFATHAKKLQKFYVTTSNPTSVTYAACLDLSDALRDYGAAVNASRNNQGGHCSYEYAVGNSRGVAEIDVNPDNTRGRVDRGTRVELQLRIRENWYRRD